MITPEEQEKLESAVRELYEVAKKHQRQPGFFASMISMAAAAMMRSGYTRERIIELMDQGIKAAQQTGDA